MMTPGICVSPTRESIAQSSPSYRRQPRRRPRNRHRKASDAWWRLNLRQRRYVEGVISGKTKFAAALEAGYSRASAENAGHIIEGPDVRKAFEAICQQAISIELLALRVREGLDAMQTRFFDYKGVITDQRQVIAWDIRLKYIELAVKYADYYRDKQELTPPSDESDVEVLRKLFARAEAAAAEEDAAAGAKDRAGDGGVE